MRQRILVVLALAAAVLAALGLVMRFGRTSQPLRLVNVTGAYRRYEYVQHTDIIESGAEQTKTRQSRCDLLFTGRSAEGGSYRALITPINFEALIDGVRTEGAVPQLHQNILQDSRGRPLIDNRADLYPLDMLNAPEFFPFLTGRGTFPGEEWEDQFRVVLPPYGQQMIVLLRTRFSGYSRVGAERLVRLSYAAKGETLYRAPDTGKSEKAAFAVEGFSLWDARLGVPYSLEHEMQLRTLDFDRIRGAGAAAGDETFATQTLQRTRLRLLLKSKTKPARVTPRVTPTPAPTQMDKEFF